MTTPITPEQLIQTLLLKSIFSHEVDILGLTQPEYYAIKALVQSAAQPEPQAVREAGDVDEFHAAMRHVIAIAKAYKADESAGGNYKGANESNKRAIEYAEKLLSTPQAVSE